MIAAASFGTESAISDGPRFEHDCKECYFLGQCHEVPPAWERREPYDLYYCRIGGMPDTVIARYGTERHCYYSGIVFAGMPGQPVIPPLREALRRAIAYGLRGETP